VWPVCEPIPKKKTYVKKLSEIIRMAEDGEFGDFQKDGIFTGKSFYTLKTLRESCGKQYSFREEFDYPKEWLEER
jgi:hypothetical protein